MSDPHADVSAAATRSHAILNAATNLLGVSLVIITGLHLTDYSSRTFADEIALAAAACLMPSCLLSYLFLRGGPKLCERLADYLFLIAQGLLFACVVALWF